MLTLIIFSFIAIVLFGVATMFFRNEPSLGVLLIIAAILMGVTGFGISKRQVYKTNKIPHEATAKLETDLILIRGDGVPTQIEKDVKFLRGPVFIVEEQRWNIWGEKLETVYRGLNSP